VGDDLVDRHITATQWLEQAALHGSHEVHLTTPHAAGDGFVDILEMNVPDAIRVPLRELDWIDSADPQVTGVEAPRDRRELDEQLDLVRVLHHGPYVGMDHVLQPTVSSEIRDPLQHGREVLPLLVLERPLP
jgi:hypothetical protein